MLPIKGEIIQMCWVVPDLDKAMQHWLDVGRAGPFLVLRHASDNFDIELFHRGKPTRIDGSVAWAQAGGVQVELAQQHCDSPSAFRDMYSMGEGGFHHIGMWTEDYDAGYTQLKNQGHDVAMEGFFGPLRSRFAYFDTRHTLGCMLELTDRTPPQIELYDTVAAISKDWDGSDPIRSVI